MLGMLVQRFDFIDHLDYELRTQTTLTVKPADFRIRVRQRPDVHIQRTGGIEALREQAQRAAACRLARPAGAAPRHQAVGPVRLEPRHRGVHRHAGGPGGDRARLRRDRGPARRARGRPAGGRRDRGGHRVLQRLSPDNATAFCTWISTAAPEAAAGVSYTVFGCGNTEWGSTYQAVPTLVDTELERHGGVRIHDRGAGNAAADFDADYRAWHGTLWADLAEALDLPDEVATAATSGPRLSITLTNRQVTNPVVLSYQAHPATVRENRELSRPRPAGRLSVQYDTSRSRFLPRWPTNPATTSASSRATARRRAPRHGPVRPRCRPVRHHHPQQWRTRTCRSRSRPRSSACWAAASSCTTSRAGRRLRSSPGIRRTPSSGGHRGHGRGRRGFGSPLSRAHLLPEPVGARCARRVPSCSVPFEEYLDLLPPLRPRFYSISSSPGQPQHVQRDRGAAAGTGAVGCRNPYRRVLGVRRADRGERDLFAFVRHPAIPFRPPENPHTPMIMVGRALASRRSAGSSRTVPRCSPRAC